MTNNPGQTVGTIEDFRTGDRWFEPPARPIFFPRIDDSHYDRIHASIIAVHRFDDIYVERQPVFWRE